MGEKLIKEYLKDVLEIISELEQIKKDAKNSSGFKKGFYFKRTSERNFLIIGELIRKISVLSPETALKIRNRESIIGLRNFLAHAYDTVDHEQMWLFLTKKTPELKKDINTILNK